MAVKDVVAGTPPPDVEIVSHELEQRIHEYWGTDHGMGHSEIQATARDIITAAPSR